jgi:hypothetical protein
MDETSYLMLLTRDLFSCRATRVLYTMVHAFLSIVYNSNSKFSYPGRFCDWLARELLYI